MAANTREGAGRCRNGQRGERCARVHLTHGLPSCACITKRAKIAFLHSVCDEQSDLRRGAGKYNMLPNTVTNCAMQHWCGSADPPARPLHCPCIIKTSHEALVSKACSLSLHPQVRSGCSRTRTSCAQRVF